MPSVAFWPGQEGGTAEYRCRVPGRALARLGWDVIYIDHLDFTRAGRLVDAPDVLVISRIMDARLPDAIRLIHRHERTLVVYDTDDWFADIPIYNPAHRLYSDPLDNPQVMHECMELADLITCSTPELAEGYGGYGRTVVLPNYLDPAIWTGNEHYRIPHDRIHIGWMGAFHWRGGDLELLRPWLPRFLEEHPEVRFVAAGCRELLDWLGIDGLTTPDLPGRREGIDQHLRPYQDLPAMLANIDIGLVPVAYNRFNQAKSWCKGLEYNAMGIPAVASPSREYRVYVQPGVNGYLVRGQEWAHYVERAIDNLDGLRRGARATAARYFIDDHIGEWTEVYSRRLVAA